MGAVAEKVGIPSVSVVATELAGLADTAAQAQGLPSVATAKVPFEVMSGAVEDVRPACKAAVEDIIYGLTEWRPAEGAAEESEKWLVFEGEDYEDASKKMNAFFLSHHWGDGLPLVPPTKELIEWMLTGTSLPRDKVLSAGFEPRCAPITVESVAVNAVMAGARPEYMPVILGAVEQYAADNARMTAPISGTTHSFAPVLIINGPIAKELNINSSFGIFGPGWQANATIGRTISLLLINAAGSYAGPGGTLVCQSTPGRYTWCFAENETENPWQPLHVEAGFDKDTSTVTVRTGGGTQSIMVYPPGKDILDKIVRAMKGVVGTIRYGGPWDQVLILSPAHAQALADEGWSKEDVRKYVHEKARISLADVTGMVSFYADMREKLAGADKSTMVSLMGKPDNLVIVVAGGIGTDTSTLSPGIYIKRTGEIDKYKPANWSELINRAKEELLY